MENAKILNESVLFVGNFGSALSAANGQTLKTRQVLYFLENYGVKILKLNTADRINFLLNCWRIIFAKDIIIAPGLLAIKSILPFLLINKLLYSSNSSVLCIAVGGWLPKAHAMHWFVRIFCNFVKIIFVQSQRMKDELALLGVNSKVLLNFRDIKINPSKSFSNYKIKLIFISRVRLDKGIEMAVQVINKLMENNISAELDVYGPVDVEFESKINKILMSDNVQYCGCIDGTEEVVKIMKKYDLLIFPTIYPGEGIPGVLVEALFAGLPIICTDWIDLSEVVDHGVTGYLLPVDSFVFEAYNLIASLDNHSLDKLSFNCFSKACLYRPETAGRILLESLRISVNSDFKKNK